MADNRINTSLAQADQQAVLDAIDTIRKKLPFLIGLTPDERRDLPKMGDKSRAFVSQALTLAQQNADILPRSFDVVEMSRDVELAESLQPIRQALTQLQELVEDTYLEIGSEAYTAALMVYNYAQASGKSGTLDQLLNQMGQRFARKARKSAEAKTEPPKP